MCRANQSDRYSHQTNPFRAFKVKKTQAILITVINKCTYVDTTEIGGFSIFFMSKTGREVSVLADELISKISTAMIGGVVVAINRKRNTKYPIRYWIKSFSKIAPMIGNL